MKRKRLQIRLALLTVSLVTAGGSVALGAQNAPPEGSLEASLQPPSTLFTVTASDPDGDPLTYTWSADIECGTFLPRSPEDHQAEWRHPSGEPPGGCPHEEGTDHTGTITVIVSDGNGGQIRCTHEGSGEGTQDCNLYGEEIDECTLNMRLFDGTFGRSPTDEAEEERGAFTVLNGNDTDDRGGVDLDQDIVAGEKDLMRLKLYPPAPNAGGSVELDFPTGLEKIEIYRRASKGPRITPGLTPETSLEFPTSELPKTIWVEGVEVSEELRDVTFHYRYQPPGGQTQCTDDAAATIVWGALVEARHDASDAVWPDMTSPPRAQLDRHCGGGFGLRPAGPEPRGLRNCIGFRFEVFPKDIVGIADVRFDVTRQRSSRQRTEYVDPKFDDEVIETPWPRRERPNDDAREADESEAPTGAGIMFSFDGPGYAKPTFPARVRIFYEGNFREFLRVAFTGVTPSGNEEVGTRSSPVVRWRAIHRWVTSRDHRLHRTSGDERESEDNLIEIR